MREHEVKGATDVTGFGLLGHAWEMARASNVSFEIDAGKVPLISGALELARLGLLTSGDKTNRLYTGADVTLDAEIEPALASLFFDPQTAGGMLIAISADKSAELLKSLNSTYADACLIGRVRERHEHLIVVKD
jgi:selenide,water dikinase